MKSLLIAMFIVLCGVAYAFPIKEAQKFLVESIIAEVHRAPKLGVVTIQAGV